MAEEAAEISRMWDWWHGLGSRAHRIRHRQGGQLREMEREAYEGFALIEPSIPGNG